tara:strand:- start:59 stop:964 length:906 start_codon:yes stop_codon:yes gene_type:complete
MKFYILTSSNLESLKRHNDKEFSGIYKKDTVIVINSLNEQYVKEAKEYCESENLEYYITQSNGTPSKGKNSVFDIFLASDNNYCVLIDGDDFLTAHGVWFYKHLETLENPPDAVCLMNQTSLRYIDDELYWTNPFTVDYDELLSLDYYTGFRELQGLSHEKSIYFQSLHDKYYTEQRKYSEENEVHCRVTWLSKKAAQFRFDEDVVIGEDTLQMLRLKHEAVEGRLNFYSTDENPITYIYDERVGGIVMDESEYGKNYEWMDNYLNKLEAMKELGQLHVNTQLPKLIIDYPENYKKEYIDE